MPMNFTDFLAKQEAAHLRRQLFTFDSPAEPVMWTNGQPLLNFASNNYLGLANHPVVRQAAIQAIQRFGVGAGAARLVSGSLVPHQELESAIAAFKQTETALTLGSGYATNIGLIPALIGRGGVIFADRLCHASLFDGCRLSRADLRIFRHNDPAHLNTLLRRRSSRGPALIVTEGVFSMDGDLAPLPDLVHLAREYEAHLLIDDAHGTGVMGSAGRGTPEHFGVEPDQIIQMGTLSKAIGTSGGYVAGSRSLIEYLIHTCRPFIYSTAPAPAQAAAATAALRLLQAEPERRRRLWENRERLARGLLALGFSVSRSHSPILPIMVHDARVALTWSRQLLAQGLYVPAIRPPTVPKDGSRLRLTITSEHTPEQIDRALHAFEALNALQP